MKKILMVNEFSYLSTGYSTYGREIMTRFHKSGKYEVAELACYAHGNDERIKKLPWKVYPNLPDMDDEQGKNEYKSLPTAVFGEWKFEEVCLDFKPDIVIDIRDFWMVEFVDRSPFRHCYKWVIMPTVDAYPQNEQWLSTYKNADAILTYTDWSGKVLQQQTGNEINWCGSASPSASDEYQPVSNRDELKASLGLGQDIKIVGTVMRNQRRKLYPELFRAFRRYLDKSGDDNTVLYCHTSYPDRGWDIPSLIKNSGLSSKIFFTYVCENCGNAFPNVFQDAVMYCPKCNHLSAGLANVQRGVNTNTLASIMNMFDLYVQYSNCEGFGLPMVEAAACGVPIAATDYSAMSDVVRKLGGYPIPVRQFYTELETGCERAYPDEEEFADILINFFRMPQSMRESKRVQARMMFKQNYSWDTTAKKWMDIFDGIETVPFEHSWGSPPRVFNPAPYAELEKLGNVEYAKWLITHVLREPEKLHTFMEARLIRDLNYGVHLEGIAGQYYNEQSHIFSQSQYQTFDREIAYRQMAHLCERRNQWEHRRSETLKTKS